jgi:hypothetical protein
MSAMRSGLAPNASAPKSTTAPTTAAASTDTSTLMPATDTMLARHDVSQDQHKGESQLDAAAYKRHLSDTIGFRVRKDLPGATQEPTDTMAAAIMPIATADRSRIAAPATNVCASPIHD